MILKIDETSKVAEIKTHYIWLLHFNWISFKCQKMNIENKNAKNCIENSVSFIKKL